MPGRSGNSCAREEGLQNTEVASFALVWVDIYYLLSSDLLWQPNHIFTILGKNNAGRVDAHQNNWVGLSRALAVI